MPIRNLFKYARTEDENLNRAFSSVKDQFDSITRHINNRPEMINVNFFSSFAIAVAAIGNAVTTLYIPDNQPVAGSIATPTTLTLKFGPAGFLSIATGKTVTINGNIDAGLTKIFSCAGTGKVVLNKVKEVYPQWWGAKGDGTTDDTVPVQAAFDSVPSGGYTVFLPSGSYKISHVSLTVAGTTLWGNGFGNTCLLSTHLYADGPTPPIVWIKAGDCIVRGIKVGYITPPDYAVGYVAANPVTECHPIAIGWTAVTAVDNVLVEDCYIDGSLCHGIAVGYGKGSIVRNNILKNVTATGISGEMCSEALIKENRIYNSRDNGIYIESRAATITTYEEYGRDNIISNNIIIDAQQGGIGTDTTINTIISKNIIRNTWATPILVGTNHPSAGLSWNAIRPIVSDNIINDAFGNYGVGQYHTQDIVTVGGGVWGCITAELQNVDGLGDAIIEGNICNIKAPGGGYNGIYVKSAHGIAVTGNVIRGDAAKSGYGIEIGLNSGSKVTNFVVTGNTLKHFSVGLMALYADRGSIKSNIVEDAEYGLYIAHCDSIDADNNSYWSVTYESFLSDNTNLLGSLGNKIAYKTAVPTTGTWIVGDICWHSDAAVGQPLGWYCTVAGTPGTWAAMANLAA